MAKKSKKVSEHIFSIVLRSKDYIKNLSLPCDEEGNVLIEGFLGELKSISFTEGLMFELNGSNCSLKMDLSAEELKRLLKSTKINDKKR